VNYGELTNEKNRGLPDLTPREWAMMLPTIAMAILMGVAPGIFLRPMDASINRVIDRVHSRTAAPVTADVSTTTPALRAGATDR
jgi:NADH-quinone oxidoreductase subunit M